MPSLQDINVVHFVRRASELGIEVVDLAAILEKRVNIPINTTTPPDLINAIQQDPWSKSAKYGLGWVYFGIILLVSATLFRLYNIWGDKIRTALYKEEIINSATTVSPDSALDYMDRPDRHFFPSTGPLVPEKPRLVAREDMEKPLTIRPINVTVAFFRWIFYRPLPPLKITKSVSIGFPSLGVILIIGVGFVFSILYCFIPQPLFYSTMAYGSPPLAIRAGMMSVAMLPWIVATATKANFISLLTGIGNERLIVLHRWGAYTCMALALVHAVPFWYQSTKDAAGFATFKLYFFQQYYIFTTGICALAPLVFLVVHSLPILRHKAYELFAALHVPVSCIFIGMMFWHCHNYLTSWNYLFATVVILVLSWILRLFYMNWTSPLRPSWLIGEESAVTILPENAVKVTIPTQTKWRPGQHVYLRMPGIAFFENHPFTIASLCSDDFPSEYGEQYRDMTLVFRPFGGFTKKVFDTAVKKGPYKTYRAFIDGPYGGMRRQISSFDQVIFFAGGSGITAIASQLLDLIKRMRDGKATTTVVRVVWAMKRPELMEWFKEELRICRECAPPNSVHCHFFITAAKRVPPPIPYISEPRSSAHLADKLNEKINDAMQGVASKRNSALIMPGDLDAEMARYEGQDTISSQPFAAPLFPAPPKQAYTQPHGHGQVRDSTTGNRMSSLSQSQLDASRHFDFGFPQTPSRFQKNLMRFAFLPNHARRDGWRTEYGRPDIPYMLKGFSKDFGARTCVFVCGPPTMRMDVSTTVAKLQSSIWGNTGREEIYLHAENYAL